MGMDSTGAGNAGVPTQKELAEREGFDIGRKRQLLDRQLFGIYLYQLQLFAVIFSCGPQFIFLLLLPHFPFQNSITGISVADPQYPPMQKHFKRE
jgi:hypothetical protein